MARSCIAGTTRYPTPHQKFFITLLYKNVIQTPQPTEIQLISTITTMKILVGCVNDQIHGCID